jgi:ATP-binding cassette, subfamily G (WHITE), member 2
MVTGFLIRWSDIPKYWIWLAYLDFLRYAWGGLMVNQFGGGDAKVGQYQILKYYSLEDVNKWLWLLYEFTFLVAFTAATWLALHKKYAHR